MKKAFKISVVVMVSLLLTTSCATIVSGSKQTIKFSSNPSDAQVFVDNVNLGKTPLETKLERSKKDQKVKLVLEGYKDFELTLTRKTNGWVWGNILFGGLIGLIVDASDGAIYRLTPEEIKGELSKNVTLNKKSDDIYIGVVLEANQNWERIGTLESK